MAENLLNPASSLIVIGGSAGSLDVLLQILPDWDLPAYAAAVIVLHRKADGESQLTELLNAKSTWPVSEAQDKQVIAAGNIYIAPADYHLLVEESGSFSLDYSEKLNYSRPSIDVTFETGAIAFGNRLTCLLLSGANTDGTLGLLFAEKCKALIGVQEPASAATAFMPQHAINHLRTATIVPPEEMIRFLYQSVEYSNNYGEAS